MKRAAILSIACLILLPLPALSQTRRRTTASGTRRERAVQTQRGRAANASATPEAAAREGAMRLGDQVKSLTLFLYLYGPIANQLESAGELVQRNQASQTLVQQTAEGKAKVTAKLKEFRENLDLLEIQFRTTPALQRHYIKLAGVAAGAAKAEEQANANQFNQAGRSLVGVVNRLTDVLVQMR